MSFARFQNGAPVGGSVLVVRKEETVQGQLFGALGRDFRMFRTSLRAQIKLATFKNLVGCFLWYEEGIGQV
jgi:hypothetical protein